MKIINKIKEFYDKGDNKFYFSLLGPIMMATIHLISTIINYDYITLYYCIFSFVIILIKTWMWSIDKYKIKPNHYIAGLISMIMLITPMMMSFILTILYRDEPHYIFEWFIYAYALYGTIKIILSIKKIIKKNKTPYDYVISCFSLISALYTIQMMEFRLIMFTENGNIDQSMYLMQLFTQGAIFVISIIIIILFIKKLLTKQPDNNS